MNKELVSIEARQKGHSIILTATDADGEEQQINVPCEDIREIYGISCEMWMHQNGDRETSLWELWHSIAGITMSHV